MPIYFKMQHNKIELHIKLFNAIHVLFVFETTIPLKHKYIQLFPVKLLKNADWNNTFRAFIEAKSSMIASK